MNVLKLLLFALAQNAQNATLDDKKKPRVIKDLPYEQIYGNE